MNDFRSIAAQGSMSAALESTKDSTARTPTSHAYPSWSPRFWHGMRLGDWLKLVARNRFRIQPSRIGLALTVTSCTVINSIMRIVQAVVYGRKIAQTVIEHPPIFIIGHWRSGTTYLHELLVRDERFAYPTTYECFAPNHFLVSTSTISWLIDLLLPKQRPMDNMGAGADNPQEDEFALANLGCPTPYWWIAFPNEPPCYMELLDMQGVSPNVLARWKRDMRWFVQALTLATKKPLVLKSPPHTGRVAVLAELFPGARFIHITRHPDSLYLSTRHLWPTLQLAQGLQIPRNEHLDEFILEAFERMYGGFETQRPSLDPRRICDVRYEDLVLDPIGELETIYEKLDLGGFDVFRPKLEAFVSEQKDYKANRHPDLDPDIRAVLRRRWAGYFEKYGYVDCA